MYRVLKIKLEFAVTNRSCSKYKHDTFTDNISDKENEADESFYLAFSSALCNDYSQKKDRFFCTCSLRSSILGTPLSGK